eukprot:TRINITY_DN16466_c2_g1_i1.p2 TRINITY_DN16466_c2_g1~~TRINITY_DN16466_c2_g1_i1.p2  ORF type:complete len:186 (-),score=15.10 TRINITY_DN16466_c2_g1_i1:573-1130(-)
MSYFGCGTKSNKIGWTFFAVFAVLGVAFMSFFIQQYYDCYDEYDHCITQLLVEGKITSEEYQRYHRPRGSIYYDDDDIGKTGNPYIDQCELDELEECDDRVYGLSASFILCYVIATIPLYMMCCCSHPPPFREGQFQMARLPISAIAARVASFATSKNMSPRFGMQKEGSFKSIDIQSTKDEVEA